MVNIWWAHTTKPKTPIANMAYTIPNTPNVSFFPLSCATICEIKPNPGKIKIYTSGWPKNQKRCWYKIGSPPPPTS